MGRVETYRIKHPEWLHVKKDGYFSYGYNQEWYTDPWKQLAGCGPTTGTQVISYMEFKEGILDITSSQDGTAALERMETVWNYVTPRYGGGLYKTRWQMDGLKRYLEERNLPYDVKMMAIYPLRANEHSLEEVTSFLREGLESDSPIAFLNRHRGTEEGLSTWHWVPIIKMEVSKDDVRCTVFDESIERTFSVKRWLEQNVLGGGFVYIKRREE